MTISIVLSSAMFGTFVSWQAPGLERYARDWLSRVRGPVPISPDIAIAAIDDASIAKLGRFPWPRTLLARAVSQIATGQPKSIALDILLVDTTVPEEDRVLAGAIGRAGNVILGSELVEHDPYGGQAQWLQPLPLFASQAAAIGHVNAGTESDGVAREILVEQSDDQGNIIRALPLETYRIGNRIPVQSIVRGLNEITIGPRSIPVEPGVSVPAGAGALYRPARMPIEYASGAGAFASQQYSIAGLMDGTISPGVLTGKYVLVGVTGASLGQRFSSPFTHFGRDRSNQNGASFPGVEVLADALNTIVRGRFYSDMPEGAEFGCAALAAWLMLGLLAAAQGTHALLRHIAAVIFGLVLVVAAAYFCFSQLLIFPPLIATLISFGSAGITGLVAHSVQASANLDRGIREVIGSLRRFGPDMGPASSADRIAESIARAIGVPSAVLVRRHRVIGAYGLLGLKRLGAWDLSQPPSGTELIKLELGNDIFLFLAHPALNPPSHSSTQLAQALATSGLYALPTLTAGERGFLPDIFPERLEEKAQRMVELNNRIARQAEFFHSSMRSVQDGLVIAGPDGQIRFANPRASAILDLSPNLLVGRDLWAVLNVPDLKADLLDTLILNRKTLEREYALRSHRYTLRLAPVLRGADPAEPVSGIVASLADVTRQHELAQTRSDVMTLVSHEMRTPLTAIQGMTELLAQYEIEPVRRKEMTLAINEEVQRLARMIAEYLDITTLEGAKSPLRLAPVRLEAIVERSLLLFEHAAGEKSIRIVRNFDPNVPPILGDADLLARVFGNLVSNSLKYSQDGTEVSVTLRYLAERISVEVADQGYGIPLGDLERVFEKFYRVPRVQDADVPGTGLGLAFVREIVELHGGQVSVRSEPGSGSVFTVHFPGGPQSPGR